jgi:hypothetical protein
MLFGHHSEIPKRASAIIRWRSRIVEFILDRLAANRHFNDHVDFLGRVRFRPDRKTPIAGIAIKIFSARRRSSGADARLGRRGRWEPARSRYPITLRAQQSCLDGAR